MRNIELNSAKSFFLVLLMGVMPISLTHAIPADPSYDPIPNEVLSALPDEVRGYTLLRDNEEDIVYVGPRYGVLGNSSGLPLLSLATVTQGLNTYGVLNAAFDFAVDRDDFIALKEGVESVGWALSPLPFESTSGTLSINSLADGESEGVCGTVTDFETGELTEVCSNFVVRSVVALNGPTLGQLYNVQMILTGVGAQLYQKLLRGGNGISFNMEANYYAAFPAYTATIDVNYKKLSESYDAFAAVHFSNCADFQLRDFFKRESICRRNDDGEIVSLNGGECSINISYVNQRGEDKSNLFTLSDNSSVNDMNEFALQYNDEIDTLHNAVETLQKKFEDDMLEKYPTADVDKTVNYNFIFRAERLRFEDEAHFSITRKSVGGSVIKQTTIPGIAACVNTNLLTGDVMRYNGNSECVGFWNGVVQPIELLEETEEVDPGDDGWF